MSPGLKGTLAAMHRSVAEPRLPRVEGVLGIGLLTTLLAFIPNPHLGPEGFAVPKEAALVTLAFVVTLASRSLIARRFDRLEVALVCSTVLGFLAAVAARNPWVAFRAAGVTLAGVAVFVIVRGLDDRGRERVMGMTLVSVVLIAASVIGEAYSVIGRLAPPGRAPGGIIGHRNYAAHALVIGFPALSMTAMKSKSPTAFFWCMGLTLTTSAIVLSRCRAAWIAVLVIGALSLVLVAWKRPRFDSRRILICAICVVAGAALPLLVRPPLVWTSESPFVETSRGLFNHDEGSGRGRLIQYAATLKMIADHPFLGVGPENWANAYPQYASANDPNFRSLDLQSVNRLPNSDWLGFAAERGVIALACLVFAACAGARRLWRTLKDQGGTPPAITGITTLVTVVVLGTFDAVILRPESLLLAAVLLGILVPAAGRNVPGGAVVLPNRWAILVIATSLVFVLQVARVVALALVRSPDIGHRELAWRLDRGNTVTGTRLAQYWMVHSRCDLALPIAETVLQREPFLAHARTVVEVCRSSQH